MPTLLSDEEIAAREAESEKNRTAAKVNSLIDFAGLPDRHLQQCMNPDRLDRSGDWLSKLDRCSEVVGRGGIAMLWGKRGTGKTQVAVAVALRLIRRERKAALYLKATQIFRACIEAQNENRLTRQMQRYARVHLLIIDESHVRIGSDFEDRTLTDLIDMRYDAMRPTIVITNQDKKAAAESLGPSIVSRLHETGCAIEMNGTSFRSQTGGQA